ncbi:MAG: MFS transporter [Alphaproteobacteria bacterium]|nr:MFS transporter [Alphaproteobacteria bacterium]
MALQTDCTYGLLLKRRFLPLFTAQFLGAFNDNLLRSGLVVLIAYAGGRQVPLPFGAAPEVLVTLCPALLVVPFILFSYLAGQVADKYSKARLITLTKAAEIVIMAVAAYGFAAQNILLLMTLLFASGTHSAFFGPLKYSILPEDLRGDELLAGNGYVAGGTYLGILLGLIAGGLLVELPHDAVGLAALGTACTGFVASLFIPRHPPAAPLMAINFHLVHGTADIIRHARHSRDLFCSLLGLSWFLLVGSVFMTQFPNYAHSVIRGENELYTLFLTLFSVGIALGSMMCNTLLKGEITARLAPLALLGVSVFTWLMVLTTPRPLHEGLIPLGEFLSHPRSWPMLACMLMVAICGGIYMVPLYAMLQAKSVAEARSRVIAASNLFDSLFMTVMAGICAGLLTAGLSIPGLFVLTGVANLFIAALARRLTR